VKQAVKITFNFNGFSPSDVLEGFVEFHNTPSKSLIYPIEFTNEKSSSIKVRCRELQEKGLINIGNDISRIINIRVGLTNIKISNSEIEQKILKKSIENRLNKMEDFWQDDLKKLDDFNNSAGTLFLKYFGVHSFDKVREKIREKENLRLLKEKIMEEDRKNPTVLLSPEVAQKKQVFFNKGRDLEMKRAHPYVRNRLDYGRKFLKKDAQKPPEKLEGTVVDNNLVNIDQLAEHVMEHEDYAEYEYEEREGNIEKDTNYDDFLADLPTETAPDYYAQTEKPIILMGISPEKKMQIEQKIEELTASMNDAIFYYSSDESSDEDEIIFDGGTDL
jgi:hypothetical protein